MIFSTVTAEDYSRAQLALRMRKSPGPGKIATLSPDIRDLKVGQPFLVHRRREVPLGGICTNPTLPILDIVLLIAKHEGVLTGAQYLYAWQRRCEADPRGRWNGRDRPDSGPLITRFLIECSRRPGCAGRAHASNLLQA